MKDYTITNPLLNKVINNDDVPQFLAIYSAANNGKSLLTRVIVRELTPQLYELPANKRLLYIEHEAGILTIAKQIAEDPVKMPNFTYGNPPYPHGHTEKGFIEYITWLAENVGGEIGLVVIDCPAITDRLTKFKLPDTHTDLYACLTKLFLEKGINVIMTFGRYDRMMFSSPAPHTVEPYYGERRSEEYVYEFINSVAFRNRSDPYYFPIGIGWLDEPEQGKYDTILVSPEDKDFVSKEDLLEYVMPLNK